MAVQPIGTRGEIRAHVVAHDRPGVQRGHHPAAHFHNTTDQPFCVLGCQPVNWIGRRHDDAVDTLDQQPDLERGGVHDDDALADVRHGYGQSESRPNVDHRAERAA